MSANWWHSFFIEGNILVFTMWDKNGEKEEELIISSEQLAKVKDNLTISEGAIPGTFRVHESHSQLVNILKKLEIPVPSFFRRDA